MDDQPRNGARVDHIIPAEMANTFQVQMQTLLEEQAGLLHETQEVLVAWTKRRRDSIEANFRIFEARGCCKESAAIAAVYSEWLTASMDRIVSGINGARDEALRLAEGAQRSATGLQCDVSRHQRAG